MSVINRKNFLIISFVFAIQACKIGPNYKGIDVKVPEKFRFSEAEKADSVLNLKWWNLFQDDKLNEYIKNPPMIPDRFLRK